MTLYLPVGPPGCGKSFLAQQMVAAGIISSHAVIEPDHFREVLTGDMSNQEVNGPVFSIVDKIVFTRIQRDLDVYVDATNLTTKAFDKYVELTKPEKKVVFIKNDVPNEKCRDRNLARDRVVPEHAMEKMFARERGLDLSHWLAMENVTEISMTDMLDQTYEILYNKKYEWPIPLRDRDARVPITEEEAEEFAFNPGQIPTQL